VYVQNAAAIAAFAAVQHFGHSGIGSAVFFIIIGVFRSLYVVVIRAVVVVVGPCSAVEIFIIGTVCLTAGSIRILAWSIFFCWI